MASVLKFSTKMAGKWSQIIKTTYFKQLFLEIFVQSVNIKIFENVKKHMRFIEVCGSFQ